MKIEQATENTSSGQSSGSVSNQDIRLSLENIKEVVSDEDWVTAKVIKFTIIDLDGNGENEIVLWIQGYFVVTEKGDVL